MEKLITKRIKKGWKLTKKQTQYVQDYIDPRYCNNCGICDFNLKLYLGLIDVGAV